MSYRKHFLPLESDPDIFSSLSHELGVTQSLVFQDVLSIDDRELLAFVPRPVLALILVFPSSQDYESSVRKEDEGKQNYVEGGKGDDVLWFQQTINNACGLYAVLHAVCNGDARGHIKSGSALADLIKRYASASPIDRATILEDSEKLESAHNMAAMHGQTAVPESAEDEVDFHYVCFTKSGREGHMYLLDGDRKGPIDTGVVLSHDDDVLSEKSLAMVREFMRRSDEEGLNFSLMALVEQ